MKTILVVGKGGVGRSLFTAAYGQAFDAKIFEFGIQGVKKYNSSAITLNGFEGLKHFLREKIGRFSEVLLTRESILRFFEATPTLMELGMLAELSIQSRGLQKIIVDCPATGHALGLFMIPERLEKFFGDGMLKKAMGPILDRLKSGEVQIFVLGLPDKGAKEEAIELYNELKLKGFPVKLISNRNLPKENVKNFVTNIAKDQVHFGDFSIPEFYEEPLQDQMAKFLIDQCLENL